MSKQTTEELIKNFMSASFDTLKRDYQFEIYRNVDGQLMGYGIDEMSERGILQGYAKMWTLRRQNTRVILATNDERVTEADAVMFARCFVSGQYRTHHVDLEKR